MSYIKIKRKKMQSEISGRILIIRATKKLFLIVKSVQHFYEVRVEDKCPTLTVVLVSGYCTFDFE